MEDFHAAGGMGALLRELRPLLHLDTVDVEGRTLAERLDEPLGWVDRAVVRPFGEPISPVGGLVALSGSLAPDGAIFKRAAATPALFESEGRAVVFTGLEDLSRRSDDPEILVNFANLLANHEEYDDAERWVERLEEMIKPPATAKLSFSKQQQVSRY